MTSSPALDRVLRWVTAGALAVSAYLHIELAGSPYFADGQLTLSALFIGQAVVAAVAAAGVLFSSGRLAKLVALAVAAASLVALVLSVYVRVPSIGPFPVLYEPVWYGDKVAAAVAAAVATAAALASLGTRVRTAV